MQTLKEYIDEYHGGSQSQFARSLTAEHGKLIGRQQVNQWIKAGFVVETIEGADKMFSHSFRRDL